MEMGGVTGQEIYRLGEKEFLLFIRKEFIVFHTYFGQEMYKYKKINTKKKIIGGIMSILLFL